MKPRPSTSHSANAPLSDTKISIHQLVSRLIASLQPSAVKRNNILLNDIPGELLVNADENTLAYVLSNLVNSAVSTTENSCIHIEAVLTDDHTMIRVKDQDTYIYHTMEIS
jgi:signal transduction histidine kinase